MSAPQPSDEAARLAALRQYAILDTPAEPAFDDLAQLAAQLCGMPIALISFMDTQQHWFKAKVGSDLSEYPRANTFWDYTTQQTEALVIPEALCDGRFARIPLVIGEPYWRFYAGVPLMNAAGYVLGTLCVLDRAARQLRREQVAALVALGRQVVAQLELRRHIRALERTIVDCKQAEAQLLFHAFHDTLTTLPNRAYFLERLATKMTEASQFDTYCFAVLFLDLDHFKVINDSLGHIVGDRFLTAIGQRLQASVRKQDIVARFGGDEFAILLDNIDCVTAVTQLVERVQQELSRPLVLDGQELVPTVSIGVVLSTAAYQHPEEMLRDADTALYQAKARGRAGYQVFDRAMHVSALARLQLEHDLRSAIEHDELRLHYQPQIDLATGQILGVEALVRWQHPQRGLLTPAAFIPMAEETGLIDTIGEWTLREACRQTRTWHNAGIANLRVAVNLSARQCKISTITAMVAAVLAETELDPQYLQLELTESAAMESAEATIAMLHELKGLGVHLAIDDFGTGYSSLSYLKRFPIDTMKIDQSFVQHSTTDANVRAIVTAILAMAQHLHLRVIAEGVETAEQWAFLAQHHCDAAQGYLFSHPLPAEQLWSLLQRGSWSCRVFERSG